MGRISANYNISSYDYQLPKELIAQKPLINRDNSNLLVLNKRTGAIKHSKFSGIVDFLNKGDCLVINKTKVVPVRLYAKKETGGKVEVLFLKPLSISSSQNKYLALLRPYIEYKKRIILQGGIEAVVHGKTSMGETILEIENQELLKDILNKHGAMPLPPYIKRLDPDDLETKNTDKKTYQTVYAENDGSIAAPTAGLHFTENLINKIKQKHVEIAEIILHVGWGTFRPVRTNDIREHNMLPEYYEIDTKQARKIFKCKKNGGKIFAVGTTTVRALESAFKNKSIEDTNLSGDTSLFIYPGYQFMAVDAMITNLHVPKSTPLLMACAFAGTNKLFKAYKQAIKRQYRFFSYGDAMLII